MFASLVVVACYACVQLFVFVVLAPWLFSLLVCDFGVLFTLLLVFLCLGLVSLRFSFDFRPCDLFYFCALSLCSFLMLRLFELLFGYVLFVGL